MSLPDRSLTTAISAALAMLAVGACGGASSSPTKPSTGGSSSSSHGATARTQLIAANRAVSQAFARVTPSLQTDLGNNDLTHAKADVAQLHTAKINFYTAISQISFPVQFGTDVNSLLGAERVGIDYLSAVRDVDATGGLEQVAVLKALLTHYDGDAAKGAAVDNKLLGELPT